MSSEPTFSTSDLRSGAQDGKRAAAHKYKWYLGAVERPGRPAGQTRPHCPSKSIYNLNRRATKAAAVGSIQASSKVTRKHDMLEGAAVTSDESSGSDQDDRTPSPPADAGVMYSFDATRSPSHGSQILNVALAKAVAKFEEKETVKLVKSEYDVLDSEGESVGLTPLKKGKGKAKIETVDVLDADDDYELV